MDRTPETDELLNIPGVTTGAVLAEREARNGMPEYLARLWRFLNSHCRGRRNVMKTADIGVHLGYVVHSNGKMTGDGKKIVHMASKLVRRYAKPVASNCTGTHRGLYVAVTREEKDACLAQLDSRIRNLARRRRAFDAAPMRTPIPRQEKLWE